MGNKIIDSQWTEKYRPQSLEDMILPEKTRSILDTWVQNGIHDHILLISRPGQGKTSLAKVLANNVFGVDTRYINASDHNDVNTVRTVITDFCNTRSFDGRFKIVILDECDNFASKDSQKILRGLMQDCKDNARFILTANYGNRVIDAIKSRCTELDITPPIKDVAKRVLYILNKEGVTVSEEQRGRLGQLIKRFHPDVRSVVKNVQKWVNTYNVLDLPDYAVDATLLNDIFDLVLENKPVELRQYIIEHEPDFNGDYQALLAAFYHMTITSEKVEPMRRAKWTISIADHLAKFANVIDPELACSACFFSLMG